MTKPKYCPNCGHSLKEVKMGVVAISCIEDKSTGYDCYCRKCGWSGDIWPDDEANNSNKAIEESNA